MAFNLRRTGRKQPKVLADGTVDKSQYDKAKIVRGTPDVDESIFSRTMANSIARQRNAAAQEKADENRAEHRQKVESNLQGGNKAARGGTAVSTKAPTVGFRDVVAEDRAAKEEAKKAKEGLRKGRSYY